MMKKSIVLMMVGSFFNLSLFTQTSFPYDVVLEEVDVADLPGIHSFAFAQDNGKWLLIGGRLDGLHARQPFNAFPANQSNTNLYVVDIQTNQVWTSSINLLPTSLKEQLQSTNMSFYQDQDTLYLIGGYGFSASQNQHITYPNLTSIHVSELIQSIVSGGSITPHFKQITDTAFAVSGGQLGKIDQQFYLVGGHRFDGQYNPHGPDHGPGFSQAYTNQIRKFSIHNTGSLSFSNYSTISDPVHLHRRDFNLVPYLFENGAFGYLISSGVFQQSVDLPFLYPVSISNSGHTPITSFNQYLSNYHSAKASLFDSIQNEMHTLFFGGMSRYYYQGGILIEDDQVPFVKTISRLTRSADGSLYEYQLPIEMPGLKGSSAEFIPNKNIAHHPSHMMYMNTFTQDSILIGYVVGGIFSSSLNPFSNNATTNTSADASVYAVYLIRNEAATVYTIDGKNPYELTIFPNPTSGIFEMNITLNNRPVDIEYYLTNSIGQIVFKGSDKSIQRQYKKNLEINTNLPHQIYRLTVLIDHKYYLTKNILIHP